MKYILLMSNHKAKEELDALELWHSKVGPHLLIQNILAIKVEFVSISNFKWSILDFAQS